MPEKVLYIFGGNMSYGGTEAYVINYIRNINFEKVRIDIAVEGTQKGVYDEELIKRGSKLYYLPAKRRKPFEYKKKLKALLIENKYRIIHAHMDTGNGLVLKIAFDCGVPIRISHSHNTEVLTKNRIKKFCHQYFFREWIKKYATHLFACSELAAEFLYGKKYMCEGKVILVSNAIELKRYEFNPKTRDKLRHEMDLEHKFVIGTVGRLHFQKNQLFFIDVLKHLKKQIPQIHFIIIGSGPLKNEIIHKAEQEGVLESLTILENCRNVNEWLNAFDLFVLPSIFEGLPISAIEAQANGLYCLLSDRISKMTKKIDGVKFLTIEEGADPWKKEICENEGRGREENACEKLRKAGFDIRQSARDLETMYLEMLAEYGEGESV